MAEPSSIAASPHARSRRFDLADYVEATDATMGEGLLVIDLKREIREALKSRRIPISVGVFVSPELRGNGKRSPEMLRLWQRRTWATFTRFVTPSSTTTSWLQSNW